MYANSDDVSEVDHSGFDFLQGQGTLQEAISSSSPMFTGIADGGFGGVAPADGPTEADPASSKRCRVCNVEPPDGYDLDPDDAAREMLCKEARDCCKGQGRALLFFRIVNSMRICAE